MAKRDKPKRAAKLGFDPVTFGRELSAIVRDYTKRETAPLLGRIEELETRLSEVEVRR